MSTSQIYISGSALGWEYATGSLTTPYSAPGALPSPTLAEFASLPVGRVWVTTDDDFLYYKDEAGSTRFLRGRLRATASVAEGTGSIFSAKHACPDYSSSVLFSGTNITPAQDIGWTSRGKKYLYRAQEAITPVVKAFTTRVNVDITAPIEIGIGDTRRNFRYEVGLGNWTVEQQGISTSVSASAPLSEQAYFNLYTNASCTDVVTTIGTYSNRFGGTDILSLPRPTSSPHNDNTLWFVTSSLFTVDVTGDPHLYIRVETGSGATETVRVQALGGAAFATDRGNGDTFCAGIDQLVLGVYRGGECVSIGTRAAPEGGGPDPVPTNSCGKECSAILPEENHSDCTEGPCYHCVEQSCVSEMP